MSENSPRKIAIVNQKGGVGKTTTAINLGAALALLGQKTLIVDLDPQGNASTGLGIFDRDRTTYDLLLDDARIDEILCETSVENLYIAPATTDLSSADIEMASSANRSRLLSDAMSDASLDDYDYVLIDCPPALGLLTINAMVAADSVLVPLQSEFFALEGLSQLMLTLREIRSAANPSLRIEGIVLTMFDGRNNLAQQVELDARATLGDLVFETIVPRNVRVSEAPSFGIPVLMHAPGSRGSLAYKSLAAEMLRGRGNAKEQ